MKTVLAVLAFAVAAFGAPNQSDLNLALAKAEAAWGTKSDVSGIRFVRLDDCGDGSGKAGWTDMVTREIQINSACKWDAGYLQIIVTHEVGHLLIGQGHPPNTRHLFSVRSRSLMESKPFHPAWWMVFERPRITAEDRATLARVRQEKQ